MPQLRGRLMIIFWLAFIISTGLTIFIFFQVENVNVGDIFSLIMFFLGSVYIIVEILKWPLGKRKIDNSGRIASHILGDTGDTWWGPIILPRESIISAKKGREALTVWWGFIFSLFLLGSSIYSLFFE
jgi:hypothetical protein